MSRSSLRPFRLRILSMNSRARCGAGAGSRGRLCEEELSLGPRTALDRNHDPGFPTAGWSDLADHPERAPNGRRRSGTLPDVASCLSSYYDVLLIGGMIIAISINQLLIAVPACPEVCVLRSVSKPKDSMAGRYACTSSQCT